MTFLLQACKMSEVGVRGLLVSPYLLGNALPQNITCLAADRMLVFAACGNLLYALARNKEVCIVIKEYNMFYI